MPHSLARLLARTALALARRPHLLYPRYRPGCRRGTCNSEEPLLQKVAAPPGFDVTLEAMGSQPVDQAGGPPRSGGAGRCKGEAVPRKDWKRGARGETVRCEVPAPCCAKSNSENGKIGDGPGSGPAMLQRDRDDRRDDVQGEIALLLAVSYGHAKSSNLPGTAWREARAVPLRGSPREASRWSHPSSHLLPPDVLFSGSSLVASAVGSRIMRYITRRSRSRGVAKNKETNGEMK